MNNRGFTLIEILIVIGLISTLAILSIPVSVGYYNTQITKSTSDEIFSALKKAQAFSAYRRQNSSTYGVAFDPEGEDTYVLFIDPYDPDNVQNEVFDLNGVTASFDPTVTDDQIIFDSATGLPQATTTITLTKGGVSQAISICESGLVELGDDCGDI